MSIRAPQSAIRCLTNHGHSIQGTEDAEQSSKAENVNSTQGTETAEQTQDREELNITGVMFEKQMKARGSDTDTRCHETKDSVNDFLSDEAGHNCQQDPPQPIMLQYWFRSMSTIRSDSLLQPMATSARLCHVVSQPAAYICTRDTPRHRSPPHNGFLEHIFRAVQMTIIATPLPSSISHKQQAPSRR